VYERILGDDMELALNMRLWDKFAYVSTKKALEKKSRW
jgi:hypothetical protein